MSHAQPEMNGPEMNEIEAALAAWTPRAPQIDRDRLMFAAGQASRGPSVDPPIILAAREAKSPARYLWPLATSLSTAAALLLAFQLATQKPAPPVEHIASDPPAEPDQIADSSQPETPTLDRRVPLPNLADGTYLALRNRMLTTPADQWRFYRTLNDDVRPAPAAVEDDAARRPSTSRNLLHELLPPEPDRPRRDSDDAPAAQSTALHEALT
jgi:hypothetical protein